MKFQAFYMNPGEKLKKKYVNNNLSNFMSVFPIIYQKRFFHSFWQILKHFTKLFHQTQILKLGGVFVQNA